MKFGAISRLPCTFPREPSSKIATAKKQRSFVAFFLAVNAAAIQELEELKKP